MENNVHLSRFEVKRYRGIDGLTVPCLTRANLLTGPNGIGKSSLIEAMWLLTGRYNPQLIWNANIQRFWENAANPLESLSNDVLEVFGIENGEQRSLRMFFDGMPEVPSNPGRADAGEMPPKGIMPFMGRIRTYLDGNEIKGRTERIEIPHGNVEFTIPEQAKRPNCVLDTPTLSYLMTDEYLNLFSRMDREGYGKEVVKAIRMAIPQAEDVKILLTALSKPYLSVTSVHGEQMPIQFYGGGAVKIAKLVMGLFASADSIFFMDEMENGIYYSAMDGFWDSVRHWMDMWNVQLVASTHSHEFVGAAMNAFENDLEELTVHCLFTNRKTGNVGTSTFSGEVLEGARQLGLEIR